jgi:plastocyanin
MRITTGRVLGLLLMAPLAGDPPSARAGDIQGQVSILERGGRAPEDLADVVLWLEGEGLPKAEASAVEIVTEKKQFVPHVVVVPAGSLVGFPNHDPFSHNVFSPTEPEPFDLGLYPRGESRTFRPPRPGVVRVFCNVHAKMSAFIVVRDNLRYARADANGNFRIPAVPPGRYTLVAWHERSAPWSREVEVGPDGMAGVPVELDARGYRFTQHPDKEGQSYAGRGRRY